jgi:tetratricopeptide (TPR) repeat protein
MASCAAVGNRRRPINNRPQLNKLPHVAGHTDGIVVFRILIAAICGVAFAQTADYSHASALFREDKPAEAEPALRKLVKADPKDPRYWNLLGVVLDAQKRFEPAEESFRKALQLSPKSAGVLNNLGNHYMAAGKPDRAIEEFQKVLGLEPEQPNANLQVAAILVQRNDGKQALIHLERVSGPENQSAAFQLLRAKALWSAGRKPEAAAIFGDLEKTAAGPADWYSIGMAKASIADFEGAETALSRALESDPSNPDILHDLGVAALRAGHADRARQVLETLARSRPDDPEALFQLGRSIAEQGRNDDAVLVLAQARKLAPNRPDIVHTLAVTTAKAGFFGDAALAFEDYLKLRPDDETARRERGFAYSCAGKKVEALRDLEWYVGKHPNDPQGRFELGFALSVDDTAKAVSNLNEAIRLKPDFPEAYFVRGEIHERDGQPQDALPDLERAVAHRPDHVRAVAALGRVYLQLDRPRDAVRVLRSGYEKWPKDAQILMLFGRALTESGDREEGARMLKEFAKVGPDKSLARVAPGVLELLNLPPEEFNKRYEANLRSALTARSGDPEVRGKLARFLLVRNRRDEALAEYRRVLADSPPTAVAVECGRTLVEAGEFALAKQFLAIPARDPSTAGNARIDYAIALVGSNESQAALRELDSVPEKERSGDYYLVRAQVLDALGQTAPASDSLSAALERAPTRADLYIEAVYFLLRHERDAQALGLIEHGSARIPDDQGLLLLKATLLGVQNRTDDALALLKRISARWPEWGRPYLVRGIIEENHSDSQSALKDIEAAIAMGEPTAEAYYYLAQARYHSEPDDIPPAEEAIEKALELNAADPWIQALAGRLAWESHDYERSVQHLQEAIRLKKDFVTAHFWLGATYKSSGKSAEAATELAEVRRIHERNPQAESEDLEGSRDHLFAIGR